MRSKTMRSTITEQYSALAAALANLAGQVYREEMPDKRRERRLERLFCELGAEPLGDDFTAEAFSAALQRRSTPIKQVLMAGEVVVGVGNIYASEVLFKAGIRPTTPANSLSRPRANRLHAAIRSVLHRAVERGGTTFRNFSNALGETGHFQAEAAVYAREGLPCRVCGTPIKQVRMGQRSTFFCPACQKP